MSKQFNRLVFLELAKLTNCKRTRLMYAKNNARVYKKEQRLQTLSR